MMRFDRFTERAQDAAMRAYEVLQRYGHAQVDTEHLLLALVEQPGGVVAEILRLLGVECEEMTHRLDGELQSTGRTQIYGGGVNQVYITPRLKRVIDQSYDESVRLGDDHISTEHLFLAIAGERNTPAGRLLTDSGVTRQRVLDAMETVRSEWDAASPAERKSPAKGFTLRTVTGEEPELVISQGENQLRIPLQDAMWVIASLARAAAELQSLQGRLPLSDHGGG